MAGRFQLHRRNQTLFAEKACALFDRLVTELPPPATLSDWEDINVVRTVESAGLVKADIPRGHMTPEGNVVQPAAKVMALTQEGYRWRKGQGQPKTYSII